MGTKRPKTVPRWPKVAQVGTKMEQEEAKWAPRRARKAQKGFKLAPRWGRKGARWAPRGARKTQERPKLDPRAAGKKGTQKLTFF